MRLRRNTPPVQLTPYTPPGCGFAMGLPCSSAINCRLSTNEDPTVHGPQGTRGCADTALAQRENRPARRSRGARHTQEEMIDEIGLALYLRFESIFAVSEASLGRMRCPRDEHWGATLLITSIFPLSTKHRSSPPLQHWPPGESDVCQLHRRQGYRRRPSPPRVGQITGSRHPRAPARVVRVDRILPPSSEGVSATC